MEGSYNKIFLSKDNVPSKYYTFFIDILLDTIRVDIGGCIEKAYDRISQPEAARLLFFPPNKQGLAEYASKRGWQLNAKQEYTFSNKQKDGLHGDKTVPAKDIALQMLEYALELEMIV